MKIHELLAESVWDQIQNFLDELTADDVGSQDFGSLVVHYEGFSDWCQQDAQHRCELPKNDPRHLSSYDDIYKEVLQDFRHREPDAELVDSGIRGTEEYPVFYAIFQK